MSGTIGQPATSTMGRRRLFADRADSGALSPRPRRPGRKLLLSITRSGTHAIISWSASDTGFVLEQSPILSTTNWSLNGATQTTNAGIISVTVPATSGYQFFRLHNP